MPNIKSTVNFYFHPFYLLPFLLLPAVMIVPLYKLLVTVRSAKGYFFVVIMTAMTIYLAVRIFKYVIRLVSKKPALTVAETYLYDFQTGLTFYWEDIESFEIGGYRTTSISIRLYNSEKYISALKNPLAKSLYRLNTKLFHGTFTINVSLLKGNNDKILNTLNSHLKD